MRTGIFTLLLTAIGAGILTSHKVFYNTGVLMASMTELFCAANYIVASFILIYAFEKHHKTTTHVELIQAVFGKTWALAYELGFIVNVIFALTALFLIISQIIY